MKFSKLTIAALIASSFNTNAVDSYDSFDKQKNESRKGWHFYEDPLIEEEKPEPELPPPAPPAPPAPPEKVVINADWLKENMPKLLNTAIDDPSEDNIAAYYYAQRLALDKSTEFSNKTKEFFMFEETLSENNRRPNASQALRAHKFKTNDNKDETFKALFDKAGLWMFYRSDCGYCHQQFPAMESLAKIMDVDVLAISMDGILLDQQFPGVTHVVDPRGELSRKYQISITPTTMLVANDGSVFQPIKFGMASGSELVQRALYAAKRINLITEDEFKATQEVRDISIAKQPIEIEKKKLENDPSALADLLRKRLSDIDLATVSEVK